MLLIVDDDPLIADTLSFALGHTFEIVTSHSRANCLQLLRQLRRTPELALVDLGLPPHPHRPDEGFALISELLKRSPETRIIVLSGQSDDDNARHARTLGAADFVAKPCAPDTLLRILHHALSHRALDFLTDAEALEELSGSADYVETLTGRRPTSFAYPYGDARSATKRIAGLAAQAGFTLAVTTRAATIDASALDQPMLLPRISLNGYFQKPRYVSALASGIPFRLTG